MRYLRTVALAMLGLLPLAVLLVAWQVAGSDTSAYYPRPSTWFDAARGLWDAGMLGPAIRSTVTTVVVGLGVAVVLGAVLGLVTGSMPALRHALQPTLEFLRMVPPPAVVPAAVLLAGVNPAMTVGVTAFAASWPILLNVHSGVATLSPVLLDVADSLQLTRADRLRRIVLPAVLPSLVVGVRVAAPIAVVATLVVEMLTNSGGLGAQLVSAQRSFHAAQAFALLCVVGVLGLVINYVTSAIDKRVAHQRGR